MKIDVLINSFGGGGAERQASWIAPHVAERVLMLEDDRAYDPGVPAKALGGNPGSPLAKLVMLPILLVRLQFEIGDRPVLSFLIRANLLNVASKLFRPHRAIVSERQALVQEQETAGGRLRLALMRLLYPFADRCIVNARGTGEDLVRLCGVQADRVLVVYNACDAAAVRAKAQEDAETPERYLVTSGRLVGQKAQDVLLRAFARYRRNDPDMRLVILGTGSDETKLRELSADLGIADAVDFRGFEKNPFPWIARADAFVLSSRYEGFPNVILEALALGVPVIAADCAYGPRELLAPETGYRPSAAGVERAEYGILVPAPDDGGSEPAIAGLADAFALMRDDVAARYRARGPERAAQFSPEAVLEDWKKALAGS